MSITNRTEALCRMASLYRCKRGTSMGEILDLKLRGYGGYVWHYNLFHWKRFSFGTACEVRLDNLRLCERVANKVYFFYEVKKQCEYWGTVAYDISQI